MKKRWLIYILIGILFGVFDFYYQEFTQSISTSTIMWFIVAWSVWLVPVIPIVLYEAKISKSVVKSVFANILVWSVSVISYYMYIPIKLVFIGQSTMLEFYNQLFFLDYDFRYFVYIHVQLIYELLL